MRSRLPRHVVAAVAGAMLSGAVAGLRNPRAHRLTKDDPERALEFIAYVSLLAKLVDDATRRK